MQLLEQTRASVALAVKAREAAKRADPLAYYKPHRGQRRVIESLSIPDLDELHVRTPNWWGKTSCGAACFTAIGQGKKELAGIPLPQAKLPATFWALSRSYEQQVESVQAAYEAAIGDWPHVISWMDRSKGIASNIRFKYEGCQSDDPNDWSQVVFRSQHNAADKPDLGLGVRLTGVHGDEPPVESVWRELRKAGRANDWFLMMITETPVKKSEWRFLKEDFKGCLNRVLEGRLEITGSIDDILIENGGFATRAMVDRVFRRYKGDKDIKARKTGEYMDTEGDSPFGEHGYAVLGEWLKSAWEGQSKAYEIIKQDADGGLSGITVDVERFYKPEWDETYYIVFDLTGGLQHPACGHVFALRRPRMVARFGAKIGVDRSGVLEPFACGYLAALLQREYDGLVDFESNAGYGASFMRGFKEAKGKRVNRDVRIDKGGKAIEQFGFNTNKFSRARWISSCQELISQNAVKVPSIEAIECLMALRLDKNDRIVDEEHRHAEDMICLGRFGDYYLTIGSKLRVPVRPPKSRLEAVADAVEAQMAEAGISGVRIDRQEQNGALVDFGG